jgi:simple sugar transport system permease protein
MLGGLGGAMLSIGSMNLFQDGMVAGRGFLAVGAVALGRHSLHGAFAAGLIFGFFDALQLYVQTIPNSPVPSQFIQMVPYVASLVILVISSARKHGATAPAALGKSYSHIAGTR